MGKRELRQRLTAVLTLCVQVAAAGGVLAQSARDQAPSSPHGDDFGRDALLDV